MDKPWSGSVAGRNHVQIGWCRQGRQCLRSHLPGTVRPLGDCENTGCHNHWLPGKGGGEIQRLGKLGRIGNLQAGSRRNLKGVRVIEGKNRIIPRTRDLLPHAIHIADKVGLPNSIINGIGRKLVGGIINKELAGKQGAI